MVGPKISASKIAPRPSLLAQISQRRLSMPTKRALPQRMRDVNSSSGRVATNEYVIFRLKLEERTIQFADTLTLLTEENLRAARVLHAEGSLKEATKYYTTTTDGERKYVLGAIGIAQMQIQSVSDEITAAIHTLDLLLQPQNPQRSVEAVVVLTALHAHPRPGVLNSDFAQENAKARELFDCAIKALEQDDSRASNGNLHHPCITQPVVSTMPWICTLKLARLWQEGSLDRTTRALKEALGLSEPDEQIDPRLLDNMGTLQHMEGNLAEARARALYEHSLTKSTSLGPDDVAMAKEAYDKLLARYPEYIGAQILADLNQSNEAHDLLKQAMASQNSNLNLRAFYTYFLIQCYFSKPAKDLVFATLKDRDKHYYAPLTRFNIIRAGKVETRVRRA
ncbi:hypothetical protein EV702DRAFT_1220367 [Suillus placidus]|uniref:Uncharacterized protein n=1 Tax=Suillus placidus TaxID=48579 RepID=A0A9P6ZH96_9AGAM|nr:hypothetical protein EV702DRAFT_1220367 [Suillus placidus]